MKKILISAGLAALLLAGCNTPKEVADTEIGIRNIDLQDENGVQNPLFTALGGNPGENKVYERSFENAPPFIPHSLDGLEPITMDNNSCLSCHTPETAPALGTLSVPSSHLTDLRINKDLGGAVSQSRFNCTQCHVALTDAPPVLNNNFKADFRQKNGNQSSNLLEVLNEGI